MKHVDDFIDMNLRKNKYARWVLNHFRLPAVLRRDFDEFMKDNKLFCTYKNKRFRCTGASRLGDVWLVNDFERDIGYDLRVDVSKCDKWGKNPTTITQPDKE